MDTKVDLMRQLDADRDIHLAFLQDLIRTPSPNPPGDTRQAIEVVRKFLTQHGIDTRTFAPKSEAPNLVSVLTPTHEPLDLVRSLVLNGHIDHFPVTDGDQWQRHPYSGDIVDGYVHGRGVVDMKAGTAASILAFTYMHRFRSALRGRCVLEVVSDEETGGKYGTKFLLQQDPQWQGTCVLNAEPCGLDSIRFGEKGTLRMTFYIRTRGGHGAYTHRGEGAIEIAARVIHRLKALESLRGLGMDEEIMSYLERDDVRSVADKIMGEGAADSMLKPTVNIGTIHGGAKVNMIPSECTFEADIRLPIAMAADVVLSKVDELVCDVPGVTYSIQEAASNPAAASHIHHELVEYIRQNVKTVRGSQPLPISSLGATDCKHFRYRGVPAYTYGVSPATMAEKDEKVLVEEFLQTVKVHTLTAWEYLTRAVQTSAYDTRSV
ncbi:hypothetical protein BAUCODRAFT_314238 [Baudoinia panamericana UAMH 10762]|uniref:Peptidase M20 dimerisation domain-containing protein n=1 Tax=Baudoinia panamericana (strain UAMH 10762) TaxID=717646 RepID=M2LB92_BAUPA|nr:uncharacterized protein BAUCODRAFT_314238 [Baudoinia panamericana UAMH 10762]EMC91087.1 hypothetical protein BAUCODRAFT_314238 [Baudoinia panamericana UAMH 10762]